MVVFSILVTLWTRYDLVNGTQAQREYSYLLMFFFWVIVLWRDSERAWLRQPAACDRPTRSLDSMSDIVLYGLVGLMFYQAYVTIRVVRSKAYTPQQKWRQTLFIWPVPFFGAAITLAALATDSETPVRPSKDVAPQKPNNRD